MTKELNLLLAKKLAKHLGEMGVPSQDNIAVMSVPVVVEFNEATGVIEDLTIIAKDKYLNLKDTFKDEICGVCGELVYEDVDSVTVEDKKYHKVCHTLSNDKSGVTGDVCNACGEAVQEGVNIITIEGDTYHLSCYFKNKENIAKKYDHGL